MHPSRQAPGFQVILKTLVWTSTFGRRQGGVMPETPSFEVVGPDHWTFAAAAMADHLEAVLRARQTLPESLLRGAYLAAKYYFALVLKAYQVEVPASQSASFSSYRIATDIVLNYVRPTPTTTSEVNGKLTRYAALMDQLQEPVTALSKEELDVAAEVMIFFRQLARKGEEQHYHEVIGSDPSEP